MSITIGSKRDPAADHSEVYEDLINKGCNCKNNCLSKFTVQEVKAIRDNFIVGKKYGETKKKIIEFIKNINDGKKKKMVYILKGKKICRNSFVKLAGINDSTLSVYLHSSINDNKRILQL